MIPTDRNSADFDPRKGARNLLCNCLNVKSGDTVSIITEDTSHGFYDAFAAQCISEVARELGCLPRKIPCPLIDGPHDIPETVKSAITESEHVIFQARAGAQIRFASLSGKATKTISYALDIGFLGSRYCTIHQGLMEEILVRFEADLDSTKTWRITCPLGTDVSGIQEIRENPSEPVEDFTLGLFPIPIFRPVLCNTMTGRVVVSRFLMSTANRHYDDSYLILEEPVTVFIEAGRIVDLEGASKTVTKFREHYRRVSSLLKIDGDVVHSWHTGIHPAAFYPLPASVDIDRWGMIAFANPRYTHFHTCGNYAPGEIAWAVFDTTIYLDNQEYWKDGRFVFLDRPEISGLLPQFGYNETIFRQRKDIGI